MATTENDVIFDGLAEEAFPYLDDLRESGFTNMFVAHQYLMEDMGLDKMTAIKLVSAWMEQFKLKITDTTDPEFGDNLRIISLEEEE